MKVRHPWFCIKVAIILSALIITISIEELFKISLQGKNAQHSDPSTLMGLMTTSWNNFSQNQSHDVPLKLGTLSITPPLSLIGGERKLLFYLIFTTNATVGSDKRLHGKFNWRHLRTVESIFYHHPTAEVNMYSNTLPNNTFNALTELGYSIQIHRYDLKRMLIGTPAEGFIMKLEKARKHKNWYSNESNLVRMLLLYKFGGIYMDTDIIVVRPLYSLGRNIAGWQTQNRTINNAFSKFEKGNAFIKVCLKEFSQHYEQKWGFNGPQLITRIYFRSNWSSYDVEIVDRNLFYMIHWSNITSHCFEDTEGNTFDINMKVLKTEAFVVHTNTKITEYQGINGPLKNGTICKYLYNSFCVLCDKVYLDYKVNS